MRRIFVTRRSGTGAGASPAAARARWPGGTVASAPPGRAGGLLRGGLFALGAFLAVVLVSRPGPGGEAVWCHRVATGDTLSGLAERYGTGVGALARLNALRSDARLPRGLLLQLPAFQALRQGRLVLASPALVATRRSLDRENRSADRYRLSRLRNRAMVERFVRAGLLVRVPAETETFRVEGVPAWRRVGRPYTRRFLEQLAAAAHLHFGTQLRVTSLTRTVGVQRTLAAASPGAAPPTGRRRSSHLTGASLDISKQPHGALEVQWLRTVLARLARQGLLHAIEEFAQPHFHVMVLPSYGGYARRLSAPGLIGGC